VNAAFIMRLEDLFDDLRCRGVAPAQALNLALQQAGDAGVVQLLLAGDVLEHREHHRGAKRDQWPDVEPGSALDAACHEFQVAAEDLLAVVALAAEGAGQAAEIAEQSGVGAVQQFGDRRSAFGGVGGTPKAGGEHGVGHRHALAGQFVAQAELFADPPDHVGREHRRKRGKNSGHWCVSFLPKPGFRLARNSVERGDVGVCPTPPFSRSCCARQRSKMSVWAPPSYSIRSLPSTML
jgi:hypothetical protein